MNEEKKTQPTEREIERLLREQGFSRKDARKVVALGVKKVQKDKRNESRQ